MALTIDGNSLVFEGTVTVSNALDPTTGVCTLTLTPSGGVGTLPALLDGTPGLPPVLTVNTVTTLTAGQPATFTLTPTSAGGAGVASTYNVDVGLPQGATGATGSAATIAGASDLSGTALAGEFITVASTGPTAFQYSKFPWGAVLNPSAIPPYVAPGVASITMSSISIPAQPYPYYPLCFSTATTAGTTNTSITLKALLNNSTSGNVLASVTTVPSIANQNLSMIPSFGAVIGTGYGRVAANATAVVYLVASQTASTGDTWSVSSGASFTLVLFPVVS